MFNVGFGRRALQPRLCKPGQRQPGLANGGQHRLCEHRQQQWEYGRCNVGIGLTDARTNRVLGFNSGSHNITLRQRSVRDLFNSGTGTQFGIEQRHRKLRRTGSTSAGWFNTGDVNTGGFNPGSYNTGAHQHLAESGFNAEVTAAPASTPATRNTGVCFTDNVSTGAFVTPAASQLTASVAGLPGLIVPISPSNSRHSGGARLFSMPAIG